MSEAAMTFDEALAYLDGLTNYEHAPKPQAMRAVPLARMQWYSQPSFGFLLRS